ncbi:MAG: hypothetical protein FJ295_00665 [Planctomycetes bacterium]|nr:hypothetical protein [Planctomycetota bacterium]
MRRSLASYFLVAFSLISAPASLFAAIPSEMLLPGTTKGYLSLPDPQALKQKWNETQLGQLANDPIMQPFVEDLKEQLKAKLDQTGTHLGIAFEDLQGIPGGEIAIAVIQPEGDKKQHALALLVDITGHLAETRELMVRINANQIAKGAQKSVQQVGSVEVTVYKLARKKEGPEDQYAYIFIHQDQLVAVDHLPTAREMIQRFDGKGRDALANMPTFTTVMERVQGDGGNAALVRWYVDPFGYVEAVRSMQGGRKKRGTDLLKVLANQGFNAVKALGGQLRFADGQHELVHRTFVYAPKTDGKYRLAARMLDFPNSDDHQAMDWVPRDLAAHMSFNWRIKESFEFLGTLVDEYAGDDGVWNDVLQSIKQDPNGPQVDLRNELMRYAGERIVVLTDYHLPIGPKSERLAVAIQVTDPAAVAKAINKIMEADPNAVKHEVEGQVIWEIVNETSTVELEDLEIEGAGFTLVNAEAEKEKEAEKQAIPNSAATVAGEHLLISTHVDFIRELLKARAADNRLREAADYQTIQLALQGLGAGTDCLRYFTRTDEAYRPTYELVRSGKMPQAETVLGKLLNQALAPDEEGTLREQQVDGRKLPPFDAVRRYLGTAGFFTRSEADGWTIVGCLLPKEINQ